MQPRALLLSAMLIPLYALQSAPAEKAAKAEKTLKAAPIEIGQETKEESAPSEKPGAFFIELYGGYAFMQGTVSSAEDGQPATIANDTVRTNKSQNAGGFAGGVMFGYDLAQNLSLMFGGTYRSLTGRKYENYNGGGTWTQQSSANGFGVTLGLRPYVNALGGRFYAGAGWFVALPFKETTEFTASSNGSAYTAASDSLKWEDSYNFSLKGMYGELGLAYELTDNLYFTLGARALVSTSTNIDQTRVETRVTGGTTVTTTTTYRESASQDQIDAVQSNSPSTNNQRDLSRNWTTKGITDIILLFSLGYRF